MAVWNGRTMRSRSMKEMRDAPSGVARSTRAFPVADA
jgi:hypothetical protein